MSNQELLFWTIHFSKMLAQSLSAVATCLHPGVSQDGLLNEAAKIFGERIEKPFSEFISVQAITSLRDTVFKILVFLQRAAAQKAAATGGNDETLKEICAALAMLEAWHIRPKARAERRVQRRKKTKSTPRKYGTDFMDQCTKLIQAALQERYEFLNRTGADPETDFTPECFKRKMPRGVFGFAYEDMESWTSWIVDMLAHKARQGALCGNTLRKRKHDIKTQLIPRMWENILNSDG